MKILKIITCFFCIISFLIPIDISAQCSGNVTLSTQTQINNFDCNTLDGNLIIEDNNDGSDNIVSLDPLVANGFLTDVTGDLILRNCNALTSLQGLDAILSVGGDYIIMNNPVLNTPGMHGIELITIGGDFIFEDNNSMSSIAFFTDIDVVSGNVTIRNNSLLNEIDLISLETVGGSFILRNNDALVSFDFVSFTSCGALRIEDNLLLETGTSGLTDIGSAFISNNAELQNLNILTNVVNIQGDFAFLSVVQNPKLTDISGLNNLEIIEGTIELRDGIYPILDGMNNLVTVDGGIRIFSNTSLTEISGISNLVSCDFVDLFNNTLLSEISGLNSLTTVTGGSFDIFGSPLTNNLPGLSNLQEVNSDFRITSCSSFADMSMFATLNSVGGDFILENNPLLNNCCVLIDLEPIVGGDIFLSNNGSDCSNYNSIITTTPVFPSCPTDITFSTDPGSCFFSTTLDDPIVNDNCGVTNYILNLTEPNGSTSTDILETSGASIPYSFEVGNTQFTFIATDDQGNSSSCEYVVTVEDNEPPVVESFSSLTVNVDPGTCSSTQTITTPNASDNCGIINYNLVVLDETGMVIVNQATTTGETNTVTLPEGVNTIEFAATDNAETNGVSSAMYTVVDNIAPTFISCPIDVTVSNDTGTCDAIVSFIDPDVMDNCTIASYLIDLVDANGVIIYNGVDAIGGLMNTQTLPVGTNVLTYTVTDASGLANTCTYNIIVEDNEVPVWDIPTNLLTITGVCGVDDPTALLNANFPTATDNCNIQSVFLVATIYNPICGASEEIENAFQAMDAAGNVSAPFILRIILEDFTPPMISAPPADVTIFCNDAFPFAPAFLTAIDACAGDVTGDMTLTVTTSFGNCETGTIQEIVTHTYTVEDGCGNVSTEEFIVTVQNDFVVDLGPDVLICDGGSTTLDAGPGNSFSWSTGETTQTITVSASGNYSVDVTSVNGCCEADDIVVSFDSNLTAIAIGAELDCTGTPVQIIGDSPDAQVSFSWTGPGGFTSMDQNPFVSNVGTYILTVTNSNGCFSTAEAVVTANTDVPNAEAEGGSLTCIINLVQLTSNSTVNGVTYQWTGPGGFTSMDQNPTVNLAGFYTVTVTAPNGCISTVTVEVVSDQNVPNISASGGVIDCNQPMLTLMGNSDTPGINFNWSGPDGYESTEQNPVVDVAGDYTLTVEGPNGCTSSLTVNVIEDNVEPQASATGGTLDCSNTSVQLMSSSTTPGASFSWEGPNGFMSDEMNPIVSEVGVYVVTVLAPNGCSTSVSVEVIADGDLPQVSATGGTIDCNNPTVQLMGSSTTEGVQFNWSGPGGFMTDEMNPTVSEPGTYTLFVSSDNGCGISINVLVIDDTQEPEVTLSLGDANCDEGTRLINAVSNVEGLDVMWTGPNGFTSTELSPSISDAGTYTLETFPMNGCNSNHSITMNDYVNYTEEINTIDITDSNTTGQAEIIITGGTGPFSILWDNGQTGTSVVDLTEGEHTVEVTDGLGCVRVFDFFIDNLVATFEAEWIEDINLYPNPATEYVNIEFSTSSQYFDVVHIYNVHGQLMKEISLDKGNERISFSVNEWTTGVYVARIFADESSYSLRFIIK